MSRIDLLEQQIMSGLKSDSQNAFSILFRTYYKDLVLFAGNYIREKSICEDIIQSIFLNIWENRHSFEIKTSLKSYLLQSVRNNCIDEIRHKKIVDNYAAKEILFNNEIDIEHYILYSDLQDHLEEALSKLPEKYRETLVLSRIDGIKYKDISEQLNISIRTVEDRISKALQLLRISLKEYLISIALILSSYYMWNIIF